MGIAYPVHYFKQALIQRPRHAQSSVHTSLAPMHLQLLPFFLLPHFVSSLRTSEAYDIVNDSDVVLLSGLINQPTILSPFLLYLILMTASKYYSAA